MRDRDKIKTSSKNKILTGNNFSSLISFSGARVKVIKPRIYLYLNSFFKKNDGRYFP